MDDLIKKQRKEFDTLVELWKAYDKLPPIVDDDYPEFRHNYESAMKTFIDAIVNNGRVSRK